MRENAQGPDRVTETDYVSATKGPNRDTETYYKATPAPGELRDDRAAPPPSSPTLSSADTGGRLSLRTRSTPEASIDTSSPMALAASLPWLWIGGGIAALGGLAVVGGGLVLYLMLGGVDEPRSTTTEQQDDKEWEGLKVKKGLR